MFLNSKKKESGKKGKKRNWKKNREKIKEIKIRKKKSYGEKIKIVTKKC